MPNQVKLPALGENIKSGDVLSILVSEGDEVVKDQDLLELETDKATMPVPSPLAGKILKILVSEGDTVPVGGAIFEIEASADGEAPKAEKKPEKKPEGDAGEAPPKKKGKAKDAPVEDESEAVREAQEEPEPSPKPKSTGKPAKAPPPPPETAVPVIVEEDSPSDDDEDDAHDVAEKPKTGPKKSAAARLGRDVPGDGQSSAAAGPAVRRLARELGIDLRRVRPASEGSRLTEEDLRNYVRKTQAEAEAKTTKGVTPPGAPDTDSHGAVRREKMSRIRQTIARNMLHSYTTIPQLTNFDDVDITELDRIRKESAKDYQSQGIKLTTLPFLVKAVAVALKHHPVVNASVSEDGAEIIYKEYVSIGIAVDTEKGLIVPVLRDADRKNIPQITGELADLVEMARSGKFAIEDLRGGTFTISNLGAIGGTYSTPLINPPQAAILLIGRSRMMPQFIDGAFQPRLMMPLSITYDHRIVDGAAAGRFLNDVKGYLSNPGRLLLAP